MKDANRLLREQLGPHTPAVVRAVPRRTIRVTTSGNASPWWTRQYVIYGGRHDDKTYPRRADGSW